jgi:hypothetical protein
MRHARDRSGWVRRAICCRDIGFLRGEQKANAVSIKGETFHVANLSNLRRYSESGAPIPAEPLLPPQAGVENAR